MSGSTFPKASERGTRIRKETMGVVKIRLGFLRVVMFLALAALVTSACKRGGSSPSAEVKLPRGAGGIGFLPLLIMEKRGLIEKQAAAKGIPDLKVTWLDLGGPQVVNSALLSGATDFAAAGPPAFL